MYMIENMIDMAKPKNGWKTKNHRIVAVNCCICNSNVKDMDTLSSNCKIINNIPKKKIKKVTFHQLIKMGCYI